MMIHEFDYHVLVAITTRLKNAGYSLNKICEVMSGTMEEYEAVIGCHLCPDCGKHYEGGECPRCGRKVM